MNQTPGASYYRKASPNRPYLLQNQFTSSGIPPSSKSMSNLSHNLHNQSGMVMQQPRQRRRWNLPAKKESGEDIPGSRKTMPNNYYLLLVIPHV